MLFNAISIEHLSTGLIAFITVALLLNVRRYMARKAEAKMNFRRHGSVKNMAASREETDLRFLDSRDIAKQNAQVQSEATFSGTTHKPEAISKWEIEFFELSREMSAKLDVKMTAISTLTHDANRVCQRMERLIEQLEKLMERQNETFRAGSVSERKESLPNFTPEPARSPLSKAAYQRHSRDEPISGRSCAREDIFVHDSSGNMEPKKETHKNESLFPRLTSIPDLGFSEDINDLTAIGSDIFDDDSSYEKPRRSNRSSSEQAKSVSAFKDVDASAAAISTFHSPYSQTGKDKQSSKKQPRTMPKTNVENSLEKAASSGSSQSLGELLLQNANRGQAAQLQPTPRIATAQQTIIQQALNRQPDTQQTLTRGKEALFMPIGEK